VFEGVVSQPVPYAPAPGYTGETPSGFSVELGSPWFFYRQFWRAHGIDHLAALHSPEIGLKEGQTAVYSVPLLLRNDTDQPGELTLTAVLPSGWKEVKGSARYPVRAHSVYPVVVKFTGLPTSSPEWREVSWNGEVNGARAGSVSLRVFSAPTGSAFYPAGIPGP
jgi:hypothetical protein